MKYWLLKSEPSTWSWQDQKKVKKTLWDGVRNFQARNFLKEMSLGDLSFFYHTGKEKRIMGIVKVIKEHFPDKKDKTGRNDPCVCGSGRKYKKCCYGKAAG